MALQERRRVLTRASSTHTRLVSALARGIQVRLLRSQEYQFPLQVANGHSQGVEIILVKRRGGTHELLMRYVVVSIVVYCRWLVLKYTQVSLYTITSFDAINLILYDLLCRLY